MVAHLRIIVFLLYTFFLPVDLVNTVDRCPKNKQDVIKASKELGCGNDKNGNNQYLCLPNKSKTSLVEFCFQGLMGIEVKGYCLEFSEGNVTRHSCNHFSYGCPETYFYDYEIYKYPACQNINTELQCYVLDLNCTAQSNTEASPGQDYVLYIVTTLGSLIVFIMCCIIIYCYKRRRTPRNKEILPFEKKKEDIESGLETELLSVKRDQEKVNDTTVNSVSGIHRWKGKEIRMVLIGKSRSGKSATVNTIRGQNQSRRWFVTSECVQKRAARFGQKIFIVDTPGVCKSDTPYTNAKIQKEILKSICIASPGPHAIVLVLSNTSYTDDEHSFIPYFEKLFGDDIYKFLIILFTREDYFDSKEMSLEDHIKSLPLNLQADIGKCDGRVIAINNKLKGEKGDEQVKELLSMIINNVEYNNGECYNSEMYIDAEKRLHERKAAMRQRAQLEQDTNVCEIKRREKNMTC